ncbi:MAG: hypothetical protein HY242_05265 [Afipia sp.]|nr:hypothetical protein [Afipia sp.]
MRILLAIAATLTLSSLPARSAPPDNPDPALAPWFKSLKQPGTGAECCSISDCRPVEMRQDSEGYEVKIDQQWHLSAAFWLRVPANRILREHSNPTGKGILCFTPEAGILCFVPPPES